MAPEEIKQKLQELVDSAGDNPSDALLPAALLQLIKANEDNAEKIAKINGQIEKKIAEILSEIKNKNKETGNKIDQAQKALSDNINSSAESADSIASKASEQAKQDRENSARNEKIAIGIGVFTVILLLALLFLQTTGG